MHVRTHTTGIHTRPHIYTPALSPIDEFCMLWSPWVTHRKVWHKKAVWTTTRAGWPSKRSFWAIFFCASPRVTKACKTCLSFGDRLHNRSLNLDGILMLSNSCNLQLFCWLIFKCAESLCNALAIHIRCGLVRSCSQHRGLPSDWPQRQAYQCRATAVPHQSWTFFITLRNCTASHACSPRPAWWNMCSHSSWKYLHDNTVCSDRFKIIKVCSSPYACQPSSIISV